MVPNFNLEAFRTKAQLIIDNKSLIPTHEYVSQLENLILELEPGYSPTYFTPNVDELNRFLEKAKARIDNLFNHSPVGYCFLDSNGIIVTTNKAFCNLFHREQSVYEGQNIREYIHPDSIDLFEFQINKIRTTKTTLSTNLRFIKGGGRYFNQVSDNILP